MQIEDLSFDNPFELVHAIHLGPQQVLDYWCEPDPILDHADVNIFTEPNIVFEGGRGCGKTMLLKYIWYEVQILEAGKLGLSPMEHIAGRGGTAIYVRIDNATLNRFGGYDRSTEFWSSLFGHYFELQVALGYVDFLEKAVRTENRAHEWLPALSSDLAGILGFPDGTPTLETLRNALSDESRRVSEFRKRIPFEEMDFTPPSVLEIGDVTREFPKEICGHIDALSGARLSVAIDEFENFSDHQQRAINSLIRSGGEHFGFRLGIRRNGMKTLSTVQPDEFIKENADFKVVRFLDFPNGDAEYRDFLARMANKRLQSSPFFSSRDLTDIKALLGQADEEAEARDLVAAANKTTFRMAPGLKSLYGDRLHEIEERLSHPDNPLLEMMCIRYLTRQRDADRLTVDEAERRLREYVEIVDGADSDSRSAGRSFRMDYVNKYKLPLLFLLARWCKRPKLYYGFNVFTLLSSGIPRNFINLCKATVSKAHFKLPPDELDSLRIVKPSVQHEAAASEANVELKNVERIRDSGPTLKNLVLGLGELFENYHADPYLRYPELNTFHVTALDEETEAILRTAITWSVIQAKEGVQKTGPNEAYSEIYTLNRLLSPLFGISYRTRGGVLEAFGKDEIRQLAGGQRLGPKYQRRPGPPSLPEGQTTLPDEEDG